MYPDQSLYPVNSVPQLVKRINSALHALRSSRDGRRPRRRRENFLPIVADAEAGFGGPLNVFELTKAMIEAGAAGVHFEDQLSSEKKCGHLGGKVLIPTQQAVRHLIAARLAADVLDVPTVIIARTDAQAATLITSDIDPIDRQFITGERTPEGFFRTREGVDACIARGLAYAPYADLLWMETSEPNIEVARALRRSDPREVPRQAAGVQLLAVVQLEEEARRRVDRDVPRRAQCDGLQVPVHHAGRLPRPQLQLLRAGARLQGARHVGLRRVPAARVRSRSVGYTATRHQREVGTGYFDEVAQTISEGQSSTTALHGSTEAEQFYEQRSSQ